jgi:hypothetical protein
MNLNLTEDERNYLGQVNLDAFFSHLNFLVDNPEEVKKIPNGSTVIYQETGDNWADKQNDNLADRAIANGAKVVRITAPEKFSLTFPDGRKVTFNTDHLWTIDEAAKITGLDANQIRFLEVEKIVVSQSDFDSNEKDRCFDFSQIIQLQAYKLILDNQGKIKQKKRRGFGEKRLSLKRVDLQKLLEFYGDYNFKVNIFDRSPVLCDGHIVAIAPDFSNSQELLSLISSLALDWRSQPRHTITSYPPLLEVFKQLCENAWKLTESKVWTQEELEERLTLAA